MRPARFANSHAYFGSLGRVARFLATLSPVETGKIIQLPLLLDMLINRTWAAARTKLIGVPLPCHEWRNQGAIKKIRPTR